MMDEIEEWVNRVIERSADEKPKDPEKCHEFFMLCPRIYPSNN